jgi:hypothetical protein
MTTNEDRKEETCRATMKRGRMTVAPHYEYCGSELKQSASRCAAQCDRSPTT